MSKLYLGETEISSGGSGGESYDDTEITGRVSTLEEYVPEYLTKDEYDALVDAGTVDEDKLYVITDLADTTELAELATHADIEDAIDDLNDELKSTADTYYAELSSDLETLKSDITSAKNTAVSAVSSQLTTSVNAVKSQQTTSVNAVTSAQSTATTAITTAKNSAITSINTAKEFTPAISVMTESEYAALTEIDSNVLYVLTADETDETSDTTE